MRTDQAILKDVQEELKWAPELHESNIRITVDQAVVTMTGHVPSWVDRRHAEKIAKKVFGVHGVADDLEVRISGSHARDDTDLAKAALTVRRWDISVPKDKITVTAAHGVLTLEGEVDWQYQRKAAQRAVEGLIGVKYVSNQVTIHPHVHSADIRNRIENAFKRSAEIDARNITIATDGSKVTLSGTVHSWAERREAESSAWSAPGVSSVQDDLRIHT